MVPKTMLAVLLTTFAITATAEAMSLDTASSMTVSEFSSSKQNDQDMAIGINLNMIFSEFSAMGMAQQASCMRNLLTPASEVKNSQLWSSIVDNLATATGDETVKQIALTAVIDSCFKT